MSQLIIKFDKDIPSLQLIQENLSSSYCDIIAALNTAGQTIIFDRVSFGFDIKRGEEIIIQKSYPPPGVIYIQSDQEVIQSERVLWEPDWELVVKVWISMSGNYMEQSFNITVPRPPQPFPSWTWDGSSWQPPIPVPGEGNYTWDEDSQTWVELVHPI